VSHSGNYTAIGTKRIANPHYFRRFGIDIEKGNKNISEHMEETETAEDDRAGREGGD
jgi:phosphopantetheinyl transferase